MRAQAITWSAIVVVVCFGCELHAQSTEEADTTQTLIRRVRVWDGTSDEPTPLSSVLVSNNLIKSIAPDLSAAPGATVIEGGGRLLMPGIIEAHTHLAAPISRTRIRHSEEWMYVAALAAKEAEGVLMRGWTTVRDMGGPSQGLAKAIDQGHI